MSCYGIKQSLNTDLQSRSPLAASTSGFDQRGRQSGASEDTEVEGIIDRRCISSDPFLTTADT